MDHQQRGTSEGASVHGAPGGRWREWGEVKVLRRLRLKTGASGSGGEARVTPCFYKIFVAYTPVPAWNVLSNAL